MFRFLLLAVVLFAIVLQVKAGYTCQSDENCLSCESCVQNKCTSTCQPGEECIEVKYGGIGECQALCDPTACEVFDQESESCVSTCEGCQSCNGQGQCEADESLRNDCLKCPGEPGYDNCCAYDKPVAFAGHLTIGPNNTNLALAITELHCRTLDIELESLTCTQDSDCTDCDTCTVDICNAGVCEHTSVATPDAGLRCGLCADFPNGPNGRCDDGNDATFDSCEMIECKHLIKYGF